MWGVRHVLAAGDALLRGLPGLGHVPRLVGRHGHLVVHALEVRILGQGFAHLLHRLLRFTSELQIESFPLALIAA
jgi:proteasome assembly chaperone (PAC2) family protein